MIDFKTGDDLSHCNVSSFWFKLVKERSKNKLSSVMYKFLYQMYIKEEYKSPYLQCVETTLNELGMSGMWLCQLELDVSTPWLKASIKQRLQDQYTHQWILDVDSRDLFYNYRLYKTVFRYESYLNALPDNLKFILLRFRTLNHRLPVQSGRMNNIPHNERSCSKCTSDDIGDEFHYVMTCPFFAEKRKKFIPQRFWKRPNIIKFQSLFCDSSLHLLIRLTYFVKIIMNEF
jgi:hypothetical protein